MSRWLVYADFHYIVPEKKKKKNTYDIYVYLLNISKQTLRWAEYLYFFFFFLNTFNYSISHDSHGPDKTKKNENFNDFLTCKTLYSNRFEQFLR